FVMATYDLLPYYVEALLMEARHRREIGSKAYAAVTGTMSAAAPLPAIYPLLEGLAERNAASPAPMAVRTRPTAGGTVHARPASRGPVASRVLAPREVAVPEPVY